jgi:hypothetical protein
MKRKRKRRRKRQMEGQEKKKTSQLILSLRFPYSVPATQQIGRDHSMKCLHSQALQNSFS